MHTHYLGTHAHTHTHNPGTNTHTHSPGTHTLLQNSNLTVTEASMPALSPPSTTTPYRLLFSTMSATLYHRGILLNSTTASLYHRLNYTTSTSYHTHNSPT